MAESWQQVADFLLTKRDIRDWVDEVIKSIGHDCDNNCCRFNVDEPAVSIVRTSKNRGKKKFSVTENQRLEDAYRNGKFLEQRRRRTLAMKLGIPENDIIRWFRNRRRKESRRMRRNETRSIDSQRRTTIDFEYWENREDRRKQTVSGSSEGLKQKSIPTIQLVDDQVSQYPKCRRQSNDEGVQIPEQLRGKKKCEQNKDSPNEPMKFAPMDVCNIPVENNSKSDNFTILAPAADAGRIASVNSLPTAVYQLPTPITIQGLIAFSIQI